MLHIFSSLFIFFFFNDTATTEIYTLSLHDALPIFGKILTSRLSLSKHLAHNLGNLLLLGKIGVFHNRRNAGFRDYAPDRKSGSAGMPRPISYAVFCLKKKK